MDTARRPTAKYNDLQGAWGESFLSHEPKDTRTEMFNPHARGPVMYLGPNKKTKEFPEDSRNTSRMETKQKYHTE